MSSEILYSLLYDLFGFVRHSLDFSAKYKIGYLLREFLLYIGSKYRETTLYNND